MGELDFFNKKTIDIMENKKGKTLKLISYISLCVFSFVSLFSGVLAWFTARRVQDPDSDSMRVVNPTGIFNKMTIHRLKTFTKDDDGVYSYFFDQTPAGTIANDGNNKVTYEGDTSLEFGEYNMLNQRHPLFLLIELNPSDNTGVSIRAQTDAVFLGDYENNHQILEKEGNEYVPVTETVIVDEKEVTRLKNNGDFPLSSIIRFTSSSYLGDTELNAIKITNSSTVEQRNTYYLEDASALTYNAMTTLTLDPETHGTEGTTASETVMYQSNTWTKYVGFIVDYSDELIEAIYNAYLGYDIVSDPDNDLVYKCDFTMVI